MAVPPTVKSPAVNPVTAVLKLRLNDALVPAVRATPGAKRDTAGTTAVACDTPMTSMRTSATATAPMRCTNLDSGSARGVGRGDDMVFPLSTNAGQKRGNRGFSTDSPIARHRP